LEKAVINDLSDADDPGKQFILLKQDLQPLSFL